jgi:cytoskeletal protein CcmA (bactofilin family)
LLDFFTNDKDDERAQPVLNVLTDQEYEFIASKDPAGTYDRDMRESIYWILGKLEEADRKCSRYEKKIYRRFIAANFGILLGENTRVSGNIQHAAGLTVKGRFDGEIRVRDTVMVEKTGVVVANILAETVVCEGEIQGEVQASKFIRITQNGRVQGDIHAPSVKIEEGGSLDGQCQVKPWPRVVRAKEGWQKRRFRLTS